MYKSVIATLGLLPLLAGAQTMVQQEPFSAPPKNAGYELSNQQFSAAYNAPARINVNHAWDFFFNGSFIYWQPKEGGLDVANYYTLTHMQHHTLSFDFHPGFKVALGMNGNGDDWDDYIEYTYLHTQDVNHFNPPSWVEWITPIFGSPSFVNLTSVFDLDYDMLAWSMGRYFYNGKKLSLRPSFGLKGGWINQSLRNTGAQYDPVTFVASDHVKFVSWLVGPRCGIDSKWFLGQGFYVSGTAEADLLYQHFNGRFRSIQFSGTQVSSYACGRITPALGGLLGIGWGSYFNNQKGHFSLVTSYEMEYYFHQNLFFKIAEEPYLGPSMDDLMLQGLTVQAQFDF